MAESTQHTLSRVRPPRVVITYDDESLGADRKKELPFVVAVVADLSGMPKEPLPRLKERGFVNIDRDNFEGVLEKAQPRVALKVKDTLTGASDAQLGVELRFRSMEDFEPHRVAEQIQPLNELLKVRRRLSDLLARTDGNDRLVDLLSEIVGDTQKLLAVQREAGGERGTQS